MRWGYGYRRRRHAHSKRRDDLRFVGEALIFVLTLAAIVVAVPVWLA